MTVMCTEFVFLQLNWFGLHHLSHCVSGIAGALILQCKVTSAVIIDNFLSIKKMGYISKEVRNIPQYIGYIP